MLDPGSVDAVAEAGGEIIVSPNTDPAVIRRTRERGLVSLPGCLTPTEAFAALGAGAHAIKLFPGEWSRPAIAKAMAAVLPKVRLLVVGGVSAETIKDWRGSVVQGFGIGSSLYAPGVAPAEVRDAGPRPGPGGARFHGRRDCGGTVQLNRPICVDLTSNGVGLCLPCLQQEVPRRLPV